MTGQQTDPVFFEPDELGSVAYRGLMIYDAQWWPQYVGYVITGRGESGDFVITTGPDSLITRDLRAIENAYIVQAAADSFAADNNGAYASNGGTRNLVGKRLTDYLPGGRLLINPYGSVRSEPNWAGYAAVAGGCGYLSVDIDADTYMDGYHIDVLGADGATIIHNICHKPLGTCY